MEYLEWTINILPPIIAVASAVAAVTPTPVDNEALRWLRRIVDVLALNVGKAKNAGEVVNE